MTSVTETFSVPLINARVVLTLAGTNGDPVEGFVSGQTVAGLLTPPIAANGWQADLTPNSTITPSGTVWRRTVYADNLTPTVDYLSVPAAGGPYALDSILTSPPGAILPAGAVARSGDTMTGALAVPDDPYDAPTWNGSAQVPTKNAVRDKIESLVLGGGAVASVNTRTGAVTGLAEQSSLDTEVTRATTAEATKETPAGAQAKVDTETTRATAAEALKVDKSTLTTDGDLLSRASGVPARLTRAGLAADTAFTSAFRPAKLGVNTQTASYTLAITDAESIVRMNVASANNLTVPPNSSVAFPVGTTVEVAQVGAGLTTLVAGAGVTLNSLNGLLGFAGQYGRASLIKTATDTWAVWVEDVNGSTELDYAQFVASFTTSAVGGANAVDAGLIVTAPATTRPITVVFEGSGFNNTAGDGVAVWLVEAAAGDANRTPVRQKRSHVNPAGVTNDITSLNCSYRAAASASSRTFKVQLSATTGGSASLLAADTSQPVFLTVRLL